jgi:kojibiose phosphorylase
MEHPVKFKHPWLLESQHSNPELIVAEGSNFLSGNGYLGYRGTVPGWRKERFTGCVVNDTWDNADGTWDELCTVPDALFFRIENPEFEHSGEYSLGLDLRKGQTFGSRTFAHKEGGAISCSFSRFADMVNIHRVVQRITITSERCCSITLTAGIDCDVWSLNGSHFDIPENAQETETDNRITGIDLVTAESGILISIRQALSLEGFSRPVFKDKLLIRHLPIQLPAGESLTLDMAMTVFSSRDNKDPETSAEKASADFLKIGYKGIQKNHESRWHELWTRYSVKVESDDDAWGLLNFNTYHNIIATPAHTDHLPIGARGLSCQAYQGAAFWDQEIFNLPGHLYASPEAARNLLVYRHKTLDGARRKAAKLGFKGAFYAWVSGDTGDELCPDYFFKDVLTGRKIRNHFNDWQIHVSPDISYAIRSYHLASGDDGFYLNEGAEILFEVARFIASRVVWLPIRKQYEIHQVLGPDEYHENVNNNLFTNLQCRFAIQEALSALSLLKQRDPAHLEQLEEKIALSSEEIDLWKDIAEKMYIPGKEGAEALLPQFDGYFALEDILPGKLADRLKDESEYWGWPNGIACETQVIKQADIVQIFFQHPHLYDRQTMRENFLYYEKRTQHRSSLSPAIHAIVGARIGLTEKAYRYFLDAGQIDLYNSKPAFSGGTFIGGIHTAACGIARQIAVYGFGGVEACEEGIRISPALPAEWELLSFNYVYRGGTVGIVIKEHELELNCALGDGPFNIILDKGSIILNPGETRTVSLLD